MTKHQPAKRRVRARMAETGERYTTARLHVLGRPETAAAPDPAPTPEPGHSAPEPEVVDLPGPVTGPPGGPELVPDPRVVERTGRDWPEWYAMLDAWGAADRPHPEIARWLRDGHGVDSWWAQELTVRYERACGRRQPGQQADGFTISVTRTIGVPVGVVWEAWIDDARRSAWLPGRPLTVRRATPPRTARLDLGAGPERLLLTFTPKGEARAAVTVTHERLPDAAAAAAAKADWVARLDELRADLEH